MAVDLPAGFVVENPPAMGPRTAYRSGDLQPTTISFRREDSRDVAMAFVFGALPLAGAIVLVLHREWASALIAVFLGVTITAAAVHARRGLRRVSVYADDDTLVVTEGAERVFWGQRPNIRQLYRVAEWPEPRDEGTKADSYGVWVEMNYGGSFPLVTGLPDRDQAQYLEDVLEARLGITDQPTEAEMPKNRDD